MAEKTGDKVKKVALSLFAKNGYDATSIEQIAAGVGIKKSSVYAFIRSKEALFWELYREQECLYREYMERLLSESAELSPTERLFQLFKYYLLYPCDLPLEEAMVVRTFWTRIMYFPPTAMKEELLRQALEHERFLGAKYLEIITDGVTQGLIRQTEPEELLISYYSLRQGLYALLIVFMQDLPEPEKIRRIERTWADFWQGIKA